MTHVTDSDHGSMRPHPIGRCLNILDKVLGLSKIQPFLGTDFQTKFFLLFAGV